MTQSGPMDFRRNWGPRLTLTLFDVRPAAESVCAESTPAYGRFGAGNLEAARAVSVPGALTSNGASAPGMTRKFKPMMYDSSDRGLVSIARATAIAAALCIAVAAPLRAADQPSTNTPAMTPAPAAAPTKDNATAAPAAATSAATGPTKEFTEDDVNAAVKKVVDERTKDGAFV